MLLRLAFSIFFLFTCLSVAIIAGDFQVCGEVTRKGELFRNDDGPICFTLFDTKSNWWQALETCKLHGMLFAKSTSVTYDEFFKFNIHVLKRDFWIGGSNRANGMWIWADGNEMQYKRFQYEAPDISGGWMFGGVIETTIKCTLFTAFRWEKTDCNKVAPFLCQHSRKAPDDSSDITTVLGNVDNNITTAIVVREEETTVSGLMSSHQDSTVRDSTTPIGTTLGTGFTPVPRRKTRIQSKQRHFQRKVNVNGTYSPKPGALGIAVTNTTSLTDCVRICAANIDCVMMTFCMQGNYCELYENYDFAVGGSVRSEVGCVVYVDVTS